MKILLMVALAASAMLYGQAGWSETSSVSSEDVKQEMREAVDTTKSYTVQQKWAFEKATRRELDRMEKQVDHLKFKAKRAQKESQAELNQLVGDVEEKQQVAGKKLKALQSASGKAWGDIKSGLSKAMDELEKTYQRALARFP